MLSEPQRITKARKVFPNIFSLMEVDSQGTKNRKHFFDSPNSQQKLLTVPEYCPRSFAYECTFKWRGKSTSRLFSLTVSAPRLEAMMLPNIQTADLRNAGVSQICEARFHHRPGCLSVRTNMVANKRVALCCLRQCRQQTLTQAMNRTQAIPLICILAKEMAGGNAQRAFVWSGRLLNVTPHSPR